MRNLLNGIRNALMFRLKYPWIKHGMNTHCQYSTTFWSPHKHIIFGDNVEIGPGCIFQCDIEIGSKVAIAANVSFLNSDEHNFNIVGKAVWDSGHGYKFKVIVEDDVWIGNGVIIMTPSKVGRGAIIGAGSVVTKDVSPYSIVAGCPAKFIKWRFEKDQILEHERLLIERKEMSEEQRTIVL